MILMRPGARFSRLYVSGKLPTYPSPKPTFCPKREESVNVGLKGGVGGPVSQKRIMSRNFLGPKANFEMKTG